MIKKNRNINRNNKKKIVKTNSKYYFQNEKCNEDTNLFFLKKKTNKEFFSTNYYGFTKNLMKNLNVHQKKRRKFEKDL